MNKLDVTDFTYYGFHVINYNKISDTCITDKKGNLEGVMHLNKYSLNPQENRNVFIFGIIDQQNNDVINVSQQINESESEKIRLQKDLSRTNHAKKILTTVLNSDNQLVAINTIIRRVKNDSKEKTQTKSLTVKSSIFKSLNDIKVIKIDAQKRCKFNNPFAKIDLNKTLDEILNEIIQYKIGKSGIGKSGHMREYYKVNNKVKKILTDISCKSDDEEHQQALITSMFFFEKNKEKIC